MGGRACRRLRRAGLGLVVALATLALPSIALGVDYTWTGEGPKARPQWSFPLNWDVMQGPDGTVPVLNFPSLAGSHCTSSPPSGTCYTSTNDTSGITATEVTIDDEAPYQISGDQLTIGASGIIAHTARSAIDPAGSPNITMPIALGANQGWAIDGGADQSGALSFGGAITGNSTLGLLLTNGAGVGFGADTEVGDFSASGPGYVGLYGPSLNGSDGGSVSFHNGTDLYVTGGGGTQSIGPLTMSGGTVHVGDVLVPEKLNVTDGMTLGASSGLTMTIPKAAATAGIDYSQVSATGDIFLGGGHLALHGYNVVGQTAMCPALHLGDVYPLLTTTTSLTGQFGNAPNGATLPIDCGGSGNTPLVRINYTAKSVTATVVGFSTPQTATTAPKKCVVPKLKGKSLKKAKKALKKAHCKLGKVRGRKKGTHVKKQKPKPHKRFPAGHKVSINLG